MNYIYDNLVLFYTNYIKKEYNFINIDNLLNDKITNINNKITQLNINKDFEHKIEHQFNNELKEKESICNMYNNNLNDFILNLKHKLLLFNEKNNKLLENIDYKNNEEILDIYNIFFNNFNSLKTPDNFNYELIEIIDNIYIEEYNKYLKEKNNADAIYNKELNQIDPIQKKINKLKNEILLLEKEKFIFEEFKINISKLSLVNNISSYNKLLPSIPLSNPPSAPPITLIDF
jgi:hypothetical protein